MSQTLACPYAGKCSGCGWIHLSYEEQVRQKTQNFRERLEVFQQQHGPISQIHSLDDLISYKSFQASGLRDRLDFVVHNQCFGLYSQRPELVDIQQCLQLSSSLQEFYADFRKVSFPDLHGSFRLRVSPTGERGIWLDFSNVDIKRLLDKKQTLLQLQEMAHVEMGQRHKALVTKPDSQLGLGDPEWRPWFQSHLGPQNVDIFSTVAAFTQPSHVTNAWITKTLASWFMDFKSHTVLEFGSGIGNLTLPALSYEKTRVISLELDRMAAAAQESTLKHHGLRDRVELHIGDFRRKLTGTISSLDTLLVNPARNGVGQLFDLVFEAVGSQKPAFWPRHIVYMSCYPESFFLDIQRLVANGYSADQIILVDQFTQTRHIEVLSRWTLL